MQVLTTPRLVLEPQVAAHADALFPILADPRMLAWLDQPAPTSLEVLRSRLAMLESRRSGDGLEQWLNWALVRREGGGAIGFVQATVLGDGVAWVAYELGADWWGRGLAGEATRAMVEHLSACYGVVRCRASVDPLNRRSRRLLERLGFAREPAADTDGDWHYRLEPRTVTG